MQRDLHFLERSAERLDHSEAQFALDLWQHPETLRGLIDGLKLPPDVARVALGLGLEDAGPWLVLTRDGDFVTCLGRDMAPNGLHVVPATQVAALVARAKVKVAEVKAAEQRVAKGKEDAFVARLVKPGPWLSREDMQVLTAWHDEKVGTYLSYLAGQLEIVLKTCDAGALWRRPRQASETLMRCFWHAWWATVTLVPLVAHGGRERDRGIVAGSVGMMQMALAGSFPLLLRSAWAAGRYGKTVLPDLKQAYRSNNPDKQFPAMIALCTMALRHRALRAEIEKLLYGSASSFPERPEDVDARERRHRVLDAVLHETDMARAAFLQRGRSFTLLSAVERNPAVVERWPNPRDVPDDVAGPMLTMAGNEWTHDEDCTLMAMLAPAWLATVEAPDLFLPADVVPLVRTGFDFDHAMQLYRGMNKHLEPGESVRVKKVGRNQPCPCGSGRKYKKCCEGNADEAKE